MTPEEAKRYAWLYLGDVVFRVPPVCTAYWTIENWIHWTDWNHPINAAILRELTHVD